MKSHRSLFTNLVFTAIVAMTASWANHGHAKAPPGRYTISNGTVFDTQTALTWEQVISPSLYTWSNAQSYCAGLMLNGPGWRVPSMKELQTIEDETTTTPSIDPTAFPGTPSDFFWTSSPWAGGGSAAWIVNFYNGGTDLDGVANAHQVRCVR